MIRKTFSFAFKSFKNSPLLNGLNILSLTLGLSVFFLIALFLYQEKSFEKDFSRRHDIYQISTQFYNMGNLAWTTRNLEHILQELPSIERFTQFDLRRSAKVSAEGREFENTRVLLSDSSFFQVFDLPLLQGDASRVLNEPGMTVIHEEAAMRMFGTTDVVGQTLSMGERSLVISGVCESAHFKTQLDFDLVVSKKHNTAIDDRQWGSIGSYTYLLAYPRTTTEALNKQLERLVEKYIYPVVSRDFTHLSGFEEWKGGNSYLGLMAEPLLSLRNESNTRNLMTPKLNVAQFNTLIIMGLAALLIAIINFINISTAKASVRTKEVAIKRILGSSRYWLVLQFMAESFLQIGLAVMLSLACVEFVINLSPGFLKGMVDYSVTHSGEWIVAIGLFTALLTLVSGLYPAIYLSSGRVIGLLKGGASARLFSALNAALFRKLATLFQLVLSVVLIAGVITMFRQLDHLRERDLGYESGNVFILDNPVRLGKSNEAFKTELLRHAAVESATFADHFPNQTDIVVLDYMIKDDQGLEHPFISYRADPTFFEVMRMDFVMGGPFERHLNPVPDAEEANEQKIYPVVVNEAAVRAMGLEEPIGKIIDSRRRIVGVVNDFVFSELRQSISPVIIGQRDEKPYYKLAVRMSPGNFDIDAVESVWQQFSDEKLSWYEFSSNYDKLIAEEKRTFDAVLTFSFFTVTISCLGLLGLAIFNIDQRIKEFGIRKVLGASVLDVIRLFSWDFLKLILIAFCIAFPIAIYGLNVWLSDFADRIKLGPAVFIWTALVTMAFVLITISMQSLKAGRLNPVDTLKD